MTTPLIIHGFFPPPLICRVGGEYFIANSSFEYPPGIPISRSTDLVTWEQIGAALTRPTQLPPNAGRPNSGVYAHRLASRRESTLICAGMRKAPALTWSNFQPELHGIASVPIDLTPGDLLDEPLTAGGICSWLKGEPNEVTPSSSRGHGRWTVIGNQLPTTQY
ncbi:family 43 glycosylhydrolase [Arthrobacter sp. Z1-15]